MLLNCRKCSMTIKPGDKKVWSKLSPGVFFHESCISSNEKSFTKEKDEPLKDSQLTNETKQETATEVSIAFSAFMKSISDSLEKRIANLETASTVSPDELRKTIEGFIDQYVGNDIKKIEQRLAGSIVTFNDRFDALKDSINKYVEGRVQDIESIAKKKIEENAPQPIEIKINEQKFDLPTLQHPMFKHLLKCVAARLNVYIFGMPGSGKSTGAFQCADTLKLARYHLTLAPGTPESRLVGYKTPSGDIVETAFIKCYREGGVFVLEEVDNGSSALLTSLNTAIENGEYMAPGGIIKKHKDFILVATGNTSGKGPSRFFPSRQTLDAAFLDRFVFLNWEYDEKLELEITDDSYTGWVIWVQSLRKKIEEKKITIIVSPRASIIGAKLLSTGISPDIVSDMVIFKGCDKQLKESLIKEVGKPPRF